ncbi:hypothetical protein [Fundidesulfovibrio terrae]|uniref:hypothetical protein n=1 Tax=Fundidesulfovibrio terrae TaxID=2922866 RepID=UPI001FAE8506|nr:hypothetical protein [Fundidesulfovibrio terrae]
MSGSARMLILSLVATACMACMADGQAQAQGGRPSPDQSGPAPSPPQGEVIARDGHGGGSTSGGTGRGTAVPGGLSGHGHDEFRLMGTPGTRRGSDRHDGVRDDTGKHEPGRREFDQRGSERRDGVRDDTGKHEPGRREFDQRGSERREFRRHERHEHELRFFGRGFLEWGPYESYDEYMLRVRANCDLAWEYCAGGCGALDDPYQRDACLMDCGRRRNDCYDVPY